MEKFFARSNLSACQIFELGHKKITSLIFQTISLIYFSITLSKYILQWTRTILKHFFNFFVYWQFQVWLFDHSSLFIGLGRVALHFANALPTGTKFYLGHLKLCQVQKSLEFFKGGVPVDLKTTKIRGTLYILMKKTVRAETFSSESRLPVSFFPGYGFL